MRAALTRKTPAIRDFYDIRYAQQQGFDFEAIRKLIQMKVAEVWGMYTLDASYTDLKRQIETDLTPVIQNDDDFDLDKIYAFILTFKE